jgi:hypothetical protein
MLSTKVTIKGTSGFGSQIMTDENWLIDRRPGMVLTVIMNDNELEAKLSDGRVFVPKKTEVKKGSDSSSWKRFIRR